MMPFHHSWGSHPPQTASQIHIRHTQRVWGIGMPSQGHMDAPVYRSTSQVGNRFWNFGHLWNGKWCNFIMVEADIHLRLYPTSILDIYTVFEVLVCCLAGIWVHPYSFHQPRWPQILEFWVTCGVEIMPLCDSWGSHPPQTASHIFIGHVQSFWGIGMLAHRHMGAPSSSHQPGWPHIMIVFVISGGEMIQLYHGWGSHPPQTASHINIRHSKFLRYWYAVLRAYGCTLLSSSLGRAINYRYQQYFVPSTIIIVWFVTGTTIFVWHQ